MHGKLVLVTGGSGFLGSHCILAALREGYKVRTTLRSLKRVDEVRQMLRNGGASEASVKNVDFFVADLNSDEGWAEACKDCDYVLHVASPFPPATPKDPNELIVPARDGTLRALKAAKAARTVKRVVVTSSTAAIGDGYASTDVPFTEDSWTALDNPAAPVAAYSQSKTIAERAAWDWIAKEGGTMELSVINPVGIFGPVLSKDFTFSVQLVSGLLNGEIPGLPNLALTIVDVRDAADLHLKAMIDPKAAGQRFIAASDETFLWTKDVAAYLKRGLGDKARRVPTRTAPNFVLRLMALFNGAVAVIVPELGKVKAFTNQKAKTMLDWQPRSAEEALLASANTLMEHGVVKP